MDPRGRTAARVPPGAGPAGGAARRGGAGGERPARPAPRRRPGAERGRAGVTAPGTSAAPAGPGAAPEPAGPALRGGRGERRGRCEGQPARGSASPLGAAGLRGGPRGKFPRRGVLRAAPCAPGRRSQPPWVPDGPPAPPAVAPRGVGGRCAAGSALRALRLGRPRPRARPLGRPGPWGPRARRPERPEASRELGCAGCPPALPQNRLA